MNEVHYSSATDEWGTPPALMGALRALGFNFVLDVCATPGREVCTLYYPPAQNGLVQPWATAITKISYALRPTSSQLWAWMNPPYGRRIGAWIKKTVAEQKLGARICTLLPARTDTKYWHELVVPNAEIWFFKGRLRFTNVQGNFENPAPFPSALAFFRPPQEALDPDIHREKVFSFGPGYTVARYP